MKVVIIGFGWVGQANALALVLDGYDVSVYDPATPVEHYSKYKSTYKKLKHLKKTLEIDGPDAVYIVCVGDRVDEEGNQDISLIKSALDSLKGSRGKVVLRSTVLPSYLDELKFDIYLPEFLHEKAAVEECVNPHYVVVGKKNHDTIVPPFIETWRKRSVRQIDCSPEDASHIKYLSNFWNATRIAFTNEFGCSIDEPTDSKVVAHIDTLLNFVFDDQPYLHYGRSFGGHCLPKDTRAYTKWSEKQGRHTSLLRSTMISNDVHKNREEKYNHLKEWFSNWPEPEGSGWVALHILGKSIKRNLFHPLDALKRRKTVEYRKLIED